MAEKKATAPKKTSKKLDTSTKPKRSIKLPRPLRAFVGYFVGAWQEIRQVRWPNRRTTWGSTLAVLMFTAFWMVVVLGLDLLFQTVLNNLLS